ncbi:hypothetical protein FHR33_002702 [Nonomuraea dietziae]|uniref:Uncharacterized protein n=1 Tax=Nonomuraea dietziae TaxID=65515 RepID=A0A7W5VFL2_9ACTN|nr:hypothetical protein [Nonomuraea dietziae]
MHFGGRSCQGHPDHRHCASSPPATEDPRATVTSRPRRVSPRGDDRPTSPCRHPHDRRRPLAAGLLLRRRHPRARLRGGADRQRRRRPPRQGQGGHHPPEDRGPDPRDHRREPLLRQLGQRQRERAQGLRRRGQPGEVPSVLRQLLRPEGLRGTQRRHARHHQVRRLPGHGRSGRRRRRQGGHRLAERQGPRLPRRRHARPRHLDHGQSRHDRQVVRRHAGQRRGRHRGRGAGDDRPDLGDQLVVPLPALGRRRLLLRLRLMAGQRGRHRPRRQVRGRTGGHGRARRRRHGRLQPVLGRARLREGRREREGQRVRGPHGQRPQRQARQLLRLVEGAGQQGRAAQDLGRPVPARGPLRLRGPPRPCGWTRCTSGSTTGCSGSTTGS